MKAGHLELILVMLRDQQIFISTEFIVLQLYAHVTDSFSRLNSLQTRTTSGSSLCAQPLKQCLGQNQNSIDAFSMDE